ncbi:MAG: HAD hydrolase family protein [Lachnospiraceae bacterium]|nr:HAD hydrolase family protein [Lachnospiraceae bacterium]
MFINNNYKIPSNIKLVATDCDGCLTDAGMYYSENGDELKKFCTRDGVGFNLLKEAGIITAVITGEDVTLNERRFAKLKVDEYFPGAKDKLPIMQSLCEKYGITMEQVAYIGDDIGDVELLKAVGFSIAPADGQIEARSVVDYVTEAKGGEGVFREVARMILAE